MNEPRWQTVRSVLADCLNEPAGERAAFLRDRCGGDEALEREVWSLVQSSDDANDYFETLADRADELASVGRLEPMLDRTVGHFRITGVLGSGGMGDVYRARDTRLHRDVALKLLGEDADGDPKVLARFDREATVLASLNHPNIASIYGREEVDGRPVLVLELVEGETLDEHMSSRNPDVGEALRISREIAQGLEVAHAKGIVHRDLKPSNVMIAGDGKVKILDFGIAKPFEFGAVSVDAPDLTATGVLLGTVPYMSPEQVRGQALDQRTDVWALGCLLYEMLSGRKAFDRGTIADSLAAIIGHEPRCDLLPADTPKLLEELVRGTLDKRLDHRIGTVRQVRARVDELLAERASGEFAVTLGFEGQIERAREHVARYEWHEAFKLLESAQGRLDADDLARLGESAWWAGALEVGIEADERAFAAYIDASDSLNAASMAIRMADHNSRKLRPALVGGWLRRAERLLDGQPTSAAHGWLLRAQIQKANRDGEFDAALRLAGDMLKVGTDLGDLDLQAVAIHYQGKAMLNGGKTSAGMNLIEEATVAAISGELSPMATAIIYCNAISACRSLADYRRAGEWSAAAKRWCERQAISGFPGICRVVRAEVMRLHGHWADAEEEALRACAELESFAPSVARVAFHELGEVRLRLGDHEAAREAFESARLLGRDPQPGAALLQLAGGDADGAASTIRRALDNLPSDRLGRVRLLPAQVEIALDRGDFDTARVACAELIEIGADFDSPAVAAAAAHACGALYLFEGDLNAAGERLREAIRLWESANVPYECARARELLAGFYQGDGDDACAQIELQTACEAYVQLGAVPDSRRAAETLAEHWY